MSYYIYLLKDPKTNKPFYIGKGKNKRALSHLNETKETTMNPRKFNKIQSLSAAGLSPIIEYYITDIECEETAYEIEATLIKEYGRKDYDENGTLLNLCIDSRPPGNNNFAVNNPSTYLSKGKTYEEIYGIEKAKSLKEARSISSSTREVTDETKEKQRQSALKKIANGYKMPSKLGIKESEETRRKKSLAHKGKPKGPRSEETKRKISETKKKNNQKKREKNNELSQ